MENDNSDSIAAVGGVSAEAQDSSPESQTQQTDSNKNLKAEMNRKFSKINDQLTKIAQSLGQGQVQAASPVEETENGMDLNKQVDARLALRVHNQQFQEALKTFPELNETNDDYDPSFYRLVDSIYTKFVKADPTDSEALQNAIELAASKTGKTQKLVQDKFLRDETRRSRIIAEGGAAPKEQRKEKEPEINLKALSRLGIKDPEKLKARIKQYEANSRGEQ